ncbi:MAG TPA: FlgD immunoglobulin-like domain containing protein, partial [Candidatus Eisenbacteria bacterium]|nr:FlgD immunoglobulin-like domain containing protein [Candidatus Eisenbacteria bacterium]
ESEIHGTLSDGTTFVATIGPKHLDDKPGDGNGNGHADGDRGKHPLKLQIRPNPLNPKAEIRFTLARAGQVRIALYDLRGRVVRTILDEPRSAGDHVVSWEGTSDHAGRVASGVYFLKVKAPQGEDMQRVTVLK